MADQPSSPAGRVLKTLLKPFRRLKRSKSTNASASRSNPTRASGAHDSVPGNDAGSAEWTASSKYIGSILLSSDSISPGGNLTLCTVLESSHLTDPTDSARHPDPSAKPLQSSLPPSSSVPDLRGATLQGEIAIHSVVASED